MIQHVMQDLLVFRNKTHAWLKKPAKSKIRSLAGRLHQCRHWIEDTAFAKIHRLDFSGYISNDELITEYAASRDHACFYQAIKCAHIKELIEEARKTDILFENFIDIGSGKGKACFYASKKMELKQIIGVEFSKPLVDAANQNNRAFGADNIVFVNIDASDFSLPPVSSIIFLFNPFDEYILLKFLQRNIDYFRSYPCVIAYANDHHRLALARFGFNTLYRNQNSRCSLHQYIA